MSYVTMISARGETRASATVDLVNDLDNGKDPKFPSPMAYCSLFFFFLSSFMMLSVPGILQLLSYVDSDTKLHLARPDWRNGFRLIDLQRLDLMGYLM